MIRSGDGKATPAKSPSRQERLAAALRENLRRRKAQVRGRAAAAQGAIETKGGKIR
jgi:hypothetical protein